jgi:flagellar basal body-associated protein FliL
MSEEKKADEAKKDKADKADDEKPAGVPKKSSAAAGMLKVLIPALLAAGASYGGTRYAKAQNAIVVVKEKEEAEGHGKKHEEAPGPTLTLDPFLLSVFDANKKAHPMKLSVAVEFSAKAGGHDDPKVFQPRIRDSVLTHLRKMTYEEISDPTHFAGIRKELLEECKEVGAEHAEKVLVTDFVIQ